MARFPKRLIALGGLAAAGAAALRRRRAARPTPPAPSTAAPQPSAAAPQPPDPAPSAGAPSGGAPSGAAPSPGPSPSAIPRPTSPLPATPPPSPTPPSAGPLARDIPGIVARPPREAPGPSETPPRSAPGSDTEREELVEATMPDPEVLERRAGGPVDELLESETSAAAAEAAAIGGKHQSHPGDDPAMDPVYEAGGGEAEGFEIAEADLIENATHGQGRAEPLSDAFTPEVESDETTAVPGDPDEERVSEVLRDPVEERERPDDPGEGPGLTHER